MCPSDSIRRGRGEFLCLPETRNTFDSRGYVKPILRLRRHSLYVNLRLRSERAAPHLSPLGVIQAELWSQSRVSVRLRDSSRKLSVRGRLAVYATTWERTAFPGGTGMRTRRASNKDSKITSWHLVLLDRAFPRHSSNCAARASLMNTQPYELPITLRKPKCRSR